MKKTCQIVMGMVLVTIIVIAFAGCAIENPRQPNNTTTGGLTTPRVTTGSITSGTTTSPVITGTTSGPTTTGIPSVTTGSITGTGTGTGAGTTTSTRGRAGINNLPRFGARIGADNSGMLFGSAPNYYIGNEIFQDGYQNGLLGNNGYPYGNASGHFDNGYPRGIHSINEPNLPDHARFDRRYDSGAVMAQIAKNNELCRIADVVKKEVESIGGVVKANACMTDENLFVGINADLSGQDMGRLANDIEERIKNKFPQVQFVFITNDKTSMDAIGRIVSKMKNSNMDAKHINQMLQTVKANAMQADRGTS